MKKGKYEMKKLLLSLLKIIGKVFISFLLLLVVSGTIFYIHENRNPHYTKLTSDEIDRYINALKTYGKNPIDYVVSKFDDHSIVIIGEPHGIREFYGFLISLLEPLYDNGVEHVGIEFFLASDQARIDSLLTEEKFDEKLAREIVLNRTLLYFQELYDLLYKGWELNRKGKNIHFDGLYVYRSRDWNMAEIANGIADKGNKILIYCGDQHAFTKLSQPMTPIMRKIFKTPERFRMGNYLYDDFKKNPFFIKLHYPHSKVYGIVAPFLLYRKINTLPFSGILDQVFQTNKTPVGFDTDTPGFEQVAEKFSYYSAGRDSVLFSEASDGYLYLYPLTDLHSIHQLENLAQTKEELDYIKSRIPERFWGTFEKGDFDIANEGFRPENIINRLDMRGLEDLYR
jgi:hypothetical protein